VPRGDRDRVEGRLRRVEDAVRNADESEWTRTNPEARARAEQTVAATRPILVIDDDVEILAMLRDFLEGEGLAVRTAGPVASAPYVAMTIETLRELGHDVVEGDSIRVARGSAIARRASMAGVASVEASSTTITTAEGCFATTSRPSSSITYRIVAASS